MMMKPSLLISRMNDIADSVKQKDGALAVLALGSIGIEQDRLDAYSDLDFFVIVEDVYKNRFIQNLDWLHEVYPLSYAFKNTKDGYKILFDDDIYGEFAVFGRSEVPKVVQAQARCVWKHDAYHEPSLLISKNLPPKNEQEPTYHLEEALTNLYVGCSRALRGETLSGQKYIEGYALDHVLTYMRLSYPVDQHVDYFNPERRIESHYPDFKNQLHLMCSGSKKLSISAKSILEWITQKYHVNQKLYNLLVHLIDQLSILESQ